jgi:hypothetical protein
MRLSTRHDFAVTMIALLAMTTMTPAYAQAPDDPAPNAGFFSHSGGAAKAKRAKTYTNPTSFPVVPGGPAWRPLPLANLSYVVPGGQSELINLAFSAECQKLGGGQLNIRIAHSIGGVAQPPVEPYDGAQAFCSSPSPATHAGLWVRRVGPGVHVFQVEFLNPGPAGSVGVIDDWTFEFVVYE